MQILIYDSGREALQRRAGVVREVAPAVDVVAVASRAACLLRAEAAPPGSVALVDLLATDHLGFERPGERLIQRLVRSPRTEHVRVVAWSAHPVEEVVRSVHASGAAGFVASVDADEERAGLLRVLDGQSVWPAEVREPGDAETGRREPWADWFEQRHGLAWEPWMEPVLVRLAGGSDRVLAGRELVDRNAARTPSHAATRLRALSRVLAGELGNAPPVVAKQATTVLSYLASYRPLDERPAALVSLERGAEAVRTSPSIVRAAGLSEDEIEEITATDVLITAKRAGEPSERGAPPADRVHSERRWAAGQRALKLGATPADIDQIVAGVSARLDRALVAIDDARQDELYHPEALAAAALSLLTPADAERIPDVSAEAGEVRWRGRSVLELASDREVSAKDLRAFCTAVDEHVLATLRP